MLLGYCVLLLIILFGTALIIVVVGVIVIDYIVIIILMVKFGLANHRIEKNFRAIKIRCIFTNYSSQNWWGLIRTSTLQITIVYKL